MNRGNGLDSVTLSDISERLGDEWKKLAILFGFDVAKIREFEVNNPGNVQYQRFLMLTEWQQRQHSTEGQMDVLCGALEKINRNDIVEWLQERPWLAYLTSLNVCQQQLTEYYKKTTSTIPAHPVDLSRTVPMSQYSDLELTKVKKGKEISQESIQFKEVTRILDKVLTESLDSWEDMLNTEKVGSLRIIVSGGAGFGKSTLLLKVTNASIHPTTLAKFKLVFLVYLSKMHKSSCVLKAICDQIFPKNAQLQKTDLKNVLDKNEAETLILLDGLDEIPYEVLNSPAKEGEYVVSDILANRVLVKSCVIVTTRPHMIDYVLKKCSFSARVQTHGFTLKTVNKYIEDYFAENVSLGETLKQTLESNISLQSLAQIPIIVLLMCIVWEHLSKSPERLIELFSPLAKRLVSLRCNEDGDKMDQIKSILTKLGRPAFDALLNPNGVRLTLFSEEFEEEDLDEGCQLGFLQKECIVSCLEMMNVVTFLHKTFQEYAAAYYLASLYLKGKRRFLDELKRINADNVHAMKDLLRFTCGISSESPATGLILEHVQKQHRQFEPSDTLHELARMLLFESNSSKWAGELEQPIQVVWDQHRTWNMDLKLFHYYLNCVPRPPVQINEFNVVCRSYKDLNIWRDILLLHGKITPNISSIQLHTRFMALRNDDSLPSWSYDYLMSDRGSDALKILEETLQGIDERIRDTLGLSLTINKSSCFDQQCELGNLPYVSNQMTDVLVYDRSYNDVSKLTNAMQGCSRLGWVALHDTNLHTNVQCLAPLISPSLKWLTLQRCGLDDDDIPDLIRIIPARHGCLNWIEVEDNEFSVDGLETLFSHLRGLPALEYCNVGLER